MTCSAVAAAVQFPFKLAFRRPRPLGARLLRTQRKTSSFPSGHTASDLSFMFGAAQEIPLLSVPLSVATLGSHWSLMRSRIHYPSDIVAGGVIAAAVTGAAWMLWPPRRTLRRPLPALLAAGDQEAPTGEPPHPYKRTVTRFVTNRMLNPLTRPLLQRALWPRTQALIETTGRTSGQPRTVPVGNGLRGDAFWIVTEHGYGADYVKNIQHDPRMRVKVGRRWHHGTAHILADDDPRQRLRWLERPVNDALLLLIGTQQLTIRVDLDATQS